MINPNEYDASDTRKSELQQSVSTNWYVAPTKIKIEEKRKDKGWKFVSPNSVDFGKVLGWNLTVKNIFAKFMKTVRMMPYIIFGWFLYFAWFTLIFKKKINFVSRTFIPIAFTLLAVIFLTISGIYISLPYIDEGIFGWGFYPLFWTIPGLLAIAITLWVMFKSEEWGDFITITKRTKWLILWWIFIVLVAVVLFAWTNTSGTLNVFINSFTWYLIYFAYIFLMLNFIYLIYKKAIYFFFSLANKERVYMWKHGKELLIYIALSIAINYILNIHIIQL